MCCFMLPIKSMLAIFDLKSVGYRHNGNERSHCGHQDSLAVEADLTDGAAASA